MKTRELEITLRKAADFLSTVPEFDTDGGAAIVEGCKKVYVYVHYYNRDNFVAAVKALGNVKKSYTSGDYPKLEVTAEAFPITLSIPRDKVCKKIITYDCEPLFSEDEVEAL